MNQKKSPTELSKKLVARRYGICTRSVNNWVNAGVIPPGVRWTSQTVLWPVAVLDEHDRLKRLSSGSAA